MTKCKYPELTMLARAALEAIRKAESEKDKVEDEKTQVSRMEEACRAFGRRQITTR